ncbi:MOSC domain-containing protein [Colwellia sp. BRX10-3]|uniref:MOSC N-terminal beta barrel domain-containing protein n=1 Tax=Colwellia sp. BRX10-3 TaxID=2759844 RepID=UPI0015F46519|nr:MOSC N-terminal beta barrel domain-containing protein [Colwellia sp. BRX10-3]MBA6389882.1 MOSC domain-containing protein [Colwellia sp. BRX10-3]
MSQAILQNIHIYPIKSSAGIELSNSWVEEFGLAFDRRFVVASPTGEFFTARTQPTLCLIQASLTPTGLRVTAPNMPVLIIEYHNLCQSYVSVNVWQDTINAQQCQENINKWFSDYLNQPCQLLFFGADSQRFVKNKNSQVGFADGYPLLLISQASLDSLNNQYNPEDTTIAMAQFRPNIVVTNCDAFAEDTWQHIRIGEVEFEITKPCTRCIFTTIDPATAEKHPQQEPLKALKNYRQLANGDILFGQNLLALNQGQIKRGDKVEVIKRQVAPVFTVKNKSAINTSNSDTMTQFKKDPVLSEKKSKPVVTFSSFNKTITGNNIQTLLEQGEDAGLILPYSCRAGMCGSCKVKLEQGEVEQLCQDGLSDEEQQQGYILSCSCTPITDVVISHPTRQRRNRSDD